MTTDEKKNGLSATDTLGVAKKAEAELFATEAELFV
jgi:hypothetical protein